MSKLNEPEIELYMVTPTVLRIHYKHHQWLNTGLKWAWAHITNEVGSWSRQRAGMSPSEPWCVYTLAIGCVYGKQQNRRANQIKMTYCQHPAALHKIFPRLPRLALTGFICLNQCHV